MRLTEKNKNKIKRCSSVKGLRRLISVILLISFSLSGCKSILVSGDLSFTAYAPVEPMESALGIKQALLSTADFEKYGIDGESAYWMPPYHLNPIYINYDIEEPTEETLIADFKAVGYSESRERFVYAYLTPVFTKGNVFVDTKTGITIPKTGSTEEIKIPEPGEKIDPKAGYVLVLMSYEPTTKKYNIFYSTYYSYAYYSENQPTLMAGKVEGLDAYYIFDMRDTKVSIYDIDGNTISERTYLSEINSSVKEMLGIPKSWDIWERWLFNWLYWRYSVSDVQVDDELCVYFNLQVEMSRRPFDDSSIKDMIDENDEDDDYDDSDEDSGGDYDQDGDVVYFNGAVSTYSLPIGGEYAAIKFTSNITDAAESVCESSTTLDPVYVDVSTDLSQSAREKIIKDEGEKADVTAEKIIKYVQELSGYNEMVSGGISSYTANDGAKVYNAYYSKIQSALNSGYTVFDTSDMQNAGIDIYYALAGVPDLQDLKIMFNGDVKSIRDPRYYDNQMSSVMNTMFDEIGNMKYTDLSYANIVVANYLAARAFLPYYYSDMPFWQRQAYSPEYIYKAFPNEVNFLMSEGILAGYFIKDGSAVMYPFLTPGDFGKTAVDSNRPGMKKVSYSPYAAEDSAVGSDGFVKYSDYWGNSGIRRRLPIVMLYGGQKYTDGKSTTGYQVVTNDPLRGSENGKYTYCLPKMVVDDTMTLTVRQPVYIRYGGQTKYVKDITKEVTIPTKYRMVFPEGTEVKAKGNVWTGEAIKALKGLGCVTYKDKSTTKRANDATGLPYDDLSGKSWSPNVDDKTPYSWIQQMHLGSAGAIFDEGIKGQSRDVGVYTTADGTEEVIMITDESLRFYKKNDNRYKAFEDVPMDTIRRVSGYGLTVQNEDSDAEKTTEETLDEEQQYNLLADDLMPYSTTKLMICHEGDGVSLYDTNGQTMMKLISGHYYRIYPMKKSGMYVLLGYQTEQYDYNDGDLSMAKYYVIDLGKLINDESNNNVSAYIDQLKDVYHSRTHTLSYREDENKNKTYTIVKPDADNDKEYGRAVRLFTVSETSTLTELEAICKDYGVEVTDELKQYALEVAEKVRKQRQALNKYYELIGIQMNGLTVPDNWQYLMNESKVFTASYEGMLEIMLVEMVLSPDYVNPEITHPVISGDYSCLLGCYADGARDQVYEDYRSAYNEWQEKRKESDTLVKVSDEDTGVDISKMDTDKLTDTIVDLYSQRENEDDAGNITQMEFYQAVLRDIIEKYNREHSSADDLNDTTDAEDDTVTDDEEEDDYPDFETYMAELFKDISPDYGKDVFEQMQESGYEQFYTLSGIPRESQDWKESDIQDELARCRYEWQVEEIMVKYCLKTARYHDGYDLYHSSWEEYSKMSFDGDVEKQKKEFEKADCHRVIDELRKQALSQATGKSWDESIADILRKVGNSPIVK